MSFLGSFFGRTGPTQVNVSGPAVVANAAKVVSNAAPVVAAATTTCADQLKALGVQLKGIAEVIEKNTPAAAQIAATAAGELGNTETAKKANALIGTMKGGRRVSAMSSAEIAGGTRRYLKAAVRTLKQLGGAVTNAGNALPGVVVNAANALTNTVKKNVTKNSVAKANNALQAAVEQYNGTASRVNSVVGTNAPALSVSSVPAETVVNAANATAANILNAATKAAAKGGAKTKKSGSKGKKGGFFTFTPFNPNAAPAHVEGFALAGKTARAGPVTAKAPPPPPPPKMKPAAPAPAARPPARR